MVDENADEIANGATTKALIMKGILMAPSCVCAGEIPRCSLSVVAECSAFSAKLFD